METKLFWMLKILNHEKMLPPKTVSFDFNEGSFHIHLDIVYEI